jgi:hypothetical protein
MKMDCNCLIFIFLLLSFIFCTNNKVKLVALKIMIIFFPLNLRLGF